MKQLISVIMCTYNEEQEELIQAIQSILNQTYGCFELLIVLDNPDNQLIRELVFYYAQKDSRIRVIENRQNLGVARSSNRAWRMAKGQYIAKMDADDIASPQRLEKELKTLLERKLDFIAASKRNIDEQGRQLGLFVNSLDSDQIRLLLPYDNLVTQSTVLMKKSVLKALNGYMNLPSCEDYDLWLRLLFHGCSMRILPQILLKYRIRSNGICESNAYRLYLSKRFLLNLYQKSKKNPKLWKDNHAFEKYLCTQDTSPKKQQRFNQAYALFYQSIACCKSKYFHKAIPLFIQAIRLDKDMLWIIGNKLSYQIRKRIVLSIPVFHKQQKFAPKNAAQ